MISSIPQNTIFMTTQFKLIEVIINLLHISVDKYYYYLAISADNHFQIHLPRPIDFCFMNNYFNIGLSACPADMDIQPVFNEHKAIAYMCTYLNNSEEACFYTMKQALKISIENKRSSYEEMNAIVQAYASNQECSVKEVAYLFLLSSG